MYFSKIFLFLFVVFQYLQFEVCESKTDLKSTSLVTNVRASKLLKTRQHRQELEVPCRGSRKLCQQQQQLQQKKKRPRKEKKKSKKDKRCCKKLNKICKKRCRKLCNLNTKCLIRESRSCRKKFSRCTKKKETNRRPGNCGPSTKTTSINQGRDVFNKPFTSTTTKPAFVRKREKEECNHSNECDVGLCCARHQHVKICKKLIKEGQVCTRDFRNPQKRSPEMFERCPCETGLTCSASKTRHYTCQVST